MVLADFQIKKLALENGMIEPFEESSRKGVISYGLSSYGYDYRIDRKFLVPKDSIEFFDPKNSKAEMFMEVLSDTILVKPNSFVLAKSYEYFRIPRDIIGLSFGKSTLARAGIFVNVTPLEPEWEGYLTISIANLSPFPVKLYALEGIAQLVFLRADEVCKTSYADKKGKYQAQKDIVLSKVKK